MSVTTVRLQPEVELERLQLTLKAMESAEQGMVVNASAVHGWLNSWGTEHEEDAPSSGCTCPD